jgi:predicted dehydrogenase
MLKIVIAGCGGISNSWFQALQGLKNILIVGVVDLQEQAALQRKTDFQLTSAQVGTDVAAMLREVQPHIVFDCTVPEARSSVVQTALKHGCHVLSEKPMATSMADAREMIVAAEKAQRFFAVMQNRRFDPRIRTLRSVLESGTVGDLTTLNGDFYIGAHFGGFRDKMRHVLLLDMAIHSFDQARVISGADPVAVTCHEWNPHGSWYEHGASAIALFEMSNQIIYSYRGSWCSEGWITGWEGEWRAVATKGSVTWNGDAKFNVQAIARDEGFVREMKEVPILVPEHGNGHARCIHDFIDCVRTGRTPETICTENIKSLAMVFGAIESAENNNKRVPIKV